MVNPKKKMGAEIRKRAENEYKTLMTGTGESLRSIGRKFLVSRTQVLNDLRRLCAEDSLDYSVVQQKLNYNSSWISDPMRRGAILNSSTKHIATSTITEN